MSSVVTRPGRLQSLKLILLRSPLQLACLQNQRLACAQSLITVTFVHDQVLHLALAQRLSALGYTQITWGLVRCGPQFCGPWVGLESCLSSMFCCCQCWSLVRCGFLFCRPWVGLESLLSSMFRRCQCCCHIWSLVPSSTPEEGTGLLQHN